MQLANLSEFVLSIKQPVSQGLVVDNQAVVPFAGTAVFLLFWSALAIRAKCERRR